MTSVVQENSSLLIQITELKSQFDRQAITSDEVLTQVNATILKIQSFASFHPQAARECYAELLSLNSSKIRLLSFCSSFPQLFPILIIYHKAKLQQGLEEEANDRMNQILNHLDSLPESHLAIAREAYSYMLSFGSERIEQIAIEKLSKLIDVSTYSYDEKQLQFLEFLDLEKQIGSAIESYSQSDRNLPISLLSLYEDLIEHLWLFRCIMFRHPQAVAISDAIPTIFARAKSWIDPLSEAISQNKKVVSCLSRITKNLHRLEHINEEEAMPLLQAINQVIGAQKNNNRQDEGRAIGNLGMVYQQLGDFNRSIKFFQSSLTIAQEVQDELVLHQGNISLGDSYKAISEHDKALEQYNFALEEAQKKDDRKMMGVIYGKRALVFQSLKRDDEVFASYNQVLEISREINDLHMEAMTHGNLGVFYQSLEKYDEAMESNNRLLALAITLRSRSIEAKAYEGLASLYSVQKQYQEAIAQYEKVKEIAIETGDDVPTPFRFPISLSISIAILRFSIALSSIRSDMNVLPRLP